MVSSPTPTLTPSTTTLSNGAAPSILLDVDSAASTCPALVEGGARQVSADELQRSVSDGAEATTSNELPSSNLSTAVRHVSAVNLTNEFSSLDVAKL